MRLTKQKTPKINISIQMEAEDFHNVQAAANSLGFSLNRYGRELMIADAAKRVQPNESVAAC
jgi:hypothetical protein